MKNYYQILGVYRDADEELIRAAWKSRMRQWHPDLNPGDRAAEAKARELNEARDVLVDPEKRAAYDRAMFPEEHQGDREQHHNGGWNPDAYPPQYQGFNEFDFGAAADAFVADFAVEVGSIFVRGVMGQMSPRMREIFENALRTGQIKEPKERTRR